VFRLEDRAAQRFENSATGFRALRNWLGKVPIARIVFEPTGPYHKAFEATLGETFPLVKVNPLQARRSRLRPRRLGPGKRAFSGTCTLRAAD
jgi:transposase